MKHSLTLISAILLTLLILSFPARISAQGYGLYWGVSVGDRFDYEINAMSNETGIIEELHEYAYVEITELGDIRQNFTVSFWSGYQQYWANGTIINSNSTWPNLDFRIKPIGNLTFILGPLLLECSTPNTTITAINTTEVFGFNLIEVNGDVQYNYTLEFSTTNGVMYRSLRSELNLETGHYLYDISVVRITAIPDPVIVVAIALSGAILVAIVVAVKKKLT